MLPHMSIVQDAQTDDGYDFVPQLAPIAAETSKADVVFCNQEALSAGDEFDITGYPAFNAPTEFAEGLSAGADCNAINLANNHLADKNQAAIDRTLDVWDRLNPLLLTGANRGEEEQHRVATTNVNGISIALVSFTQLTNEQPDHHYSVNLLSDTDLVEQLVTEARESADLVLVSMHWGTE